MMAKFCVFAVLVVFYINSKVEALSNRFDEEHTFLNDYELEVKMPDVCEGDTFCFEKGDNYPDEMIAELVSDVNGMLLNFERPSIGDRKKRALSGFLSDEEPLCASNTTDRPMYYIIDENDRVRVVVQAPNKFEQYNSLMWCLNEGPITGKRSFLPGIFRQFIVECVTCKTDLVLFVLSDELDSETNKPKMEIAKIKGGVPACCKCQYRSKN